MTLVSAEIRRQHLLVLLSLIAISLVVLLVVAANNQYGEDEWQHLYTTSKAFFESFAGRPTHLLALSVAYRTLGFLPVVPLIAFQVIRIATAFVLYLLVRHFTPQDPLFAFLCAAVYLTYFIHDDFLLRASYMVSFTSACFYMLLALLLFFKSMAGNNWILLALSLIVLWTAVSAYEGVVPILALVTPIVVLRQQGIRPKSIAIIALWEAVIGLGLLRVILPMLGLSSENYVSDLEMELSPLVLIPRTLYQLRLGLLEPLLLQRQSIQNYAAPIIFSVATTLGILAFIRKELPPTMRDGRELRRYALWGVIGLVCTVLGFAAILPTLYGQYITRIHTISIVGEAVVIASLIWLITQVIVDDGYRWLMRFAAVGLTVAMSIAHVASLQGELIKVGAVWEDQAYFTRSLANQIPAVEPETLFIYVHPTEDMEPPFYQAQGFEYIMRYFYADSADGVWVSYNWVLYRQWSATEEGILLISDPEIRGRLWEKDALYGWDALIIVSRDPDTGRAQIMDELPPELHTPARQQIYDPYARIKQGYVPTSIQQWFPPIQEP